MMKCLFMAVAAVLTAFPGGAAPRDKNSSLTSGYQKDACKELGLSTAKDSYEAYLRWGRALDAGDRELARRNAECAVQLGGASAMYNLGSRLRELGDVQALDYLLAAGLLGNREAQAQAGEILLKRASSESQRLIALNLLVSASAGCEWSGGRALVEHAESSEDPIALVAARALLRLRIEDMVRTGGNRTYFEGWLRSVDRLVTETMRRHSDAAAKSLAEARAGCGVRSSGAVAPK